MNQRPSILCLLACLPLLGASHALAQENADDAAPTTPAAPATPATVKPTTAPPTPPAAAPEAAETPASSPIERLPPSAFPEWQVRGIPGGSLAATMHGMQWPYYPKTGIGVSGSIWVDTGYEVVKRGNPTEANSKLLVSQGRAVLRVTPTLTSGSWFGQGQAELVGNKDQSVAQPNIVDIDDLWIRGGQWHKWDLQLGRFEAFEVYHFGMGMDLNTLERLGATGSMTRSPPDVFELGGNSNIVYRQSGPTNLAAHFYPTDYLRFEILGQFGFDTASGIDTIGARPAAVFDVGWLKLKAAGDVRRQFPSVSSSKEQRTVEGGTAALQLVFNPYVEVGANFAYGTVKHYSPSSVTNPNATLGDFDTAGSVTDSDFGGFANFRLLDGLVVGAGVNYNQETDQQSGAFTHLQSFGAVQVRMLDHLFIKAVGAYAKGHIAPGGTPAWDNTMTSGRVRLLYVF